MGVPPNKVPDWLDHTANAQEDMNYTDNKAPIQDPGPNAAAAKSTTASVTH